MTDRSTTWLRAEKDREALLRGALLSEAERWLTQRSELSDGERAYIAASVTARTKAQRKTRRLTVATVAVALTAAAAFAVIAASAHEQKALADKPLVDARGVAERIVLNIEEELKPVAGTASLRRKLLSKANELLERLSQDAVSDPNTRHTSLWGRVQRGDLALSHDDLTQTRHLYDEARVIAERLAQADPSNAGWRKDVLLSYWRLLLVLPKRDCTGDRYLTAAEDALAWFDRTKALDGDAQMPGIRRFFQEYRAKRGDGPCKEAKER